MGLKISKDFYSLFEAASLLKCNVEDLIFLAVNGKFKIYFYLNLQRIKFTFGSEKYGTEQPTLEVPHVHIGLASVDEYTLREILRRGKLKEISQEIKSFDNLHAVDVKGLFSHYSKLKGFVSDDYKWVQIENNGNPSVLPWEIDRPFIANQDNLFLLDADIKLLDKTNFSNESIEINSRERETMIKIIHALAKNAYKYPEHGSLKAIVRDFEKNNNGVNEKTLTKYLKEFVTL